MRHNSFTLAGGALTLLLVGAARPSQADQTFAKDNASDAAYNGGSFSGLNGGFGFGAWSVSSPNGGQFIGNSNGNGGAVGPGINSTGNKSFGIYSNGAQTTATRPLTTPLAAGQTLSLDFDSGYVDNNNSSVGFYLSNSASSPLTVYFAKGDGQYRVVDSSGTSGSNLGFTDGGLHAAFTLTTDTTYSFSLTQFNGGATYTRTGTLTGGINSISFFNNNAGSGSSHDVFANNLSVTTPAPSALLPMASGLFVLFGSLKFRRRRA